MMDKALNKNGDAVFGDKSPQKTWSGKDRGSQVSFNDADYGQNAAAASGAASGSK
jgi:hypothetical protein